MKAGNYEIPYQNGVIASYAGYGKYEWRANEPFELVLAFDHFGRGRSSALGYFKDEQGRLWPMFLSVLHEVIPHLKSGKIHGRWTGVKRGTNFSICLLEALP